MTDNYWFQPRKHMRLAGYNYAQNGAYFVTICVKNKKWQFGRVVQNEVRLSEMGKVALAMWNRLPRWYGYVRLDEFIIMPNHLHGIIVIEHPEANLEGISGKSRPLWRIIAAFKAATTTTIRKQLKQQFAWQRNFHDHIIRNEVVYERIQRYIVENPMRWGHETHLFRL